MKDYIKNQDQSNSAAHVRQFRERLRSQGLVRKDAWILPQFSGVLSSIEKSLRHPSGLQSAPDLSPSSWTIDKLQEELNASVLVREHRIQVTRVEGVEPSLKLTMKEYGDLTILLAIASGQIVVETYLWPESAIIDVAAFNACVLETHMYLPLSKLGISDIAGVRSYILTGSLDACSTLNNIMFELETMADNAFAVAELYADFLKGDDQ